MFETRCHCGNVQLSMNEVPKDITRCNCSICHRYGALWAYYTGEQVSIIQKDHLIETYQWATKKITFHACSKCACTTHYTGIRKDGSVKVGINTRMAEHELIKDIPVRLFDGANTWKYID